MSTGRSKMATVDEATRTKIVADVQCSLDAVAKQLDADQGDFGPIASNALNTTTRSGIGAFGTAAAGAATAIIGAAKGHSDAVVIGGLAFAAVALLALSLIVMSDHKARSSAYGALESALPGIITAASAFIAPTPDANSESSASSSYVIPVHDQVRVKLSTTGDELFDVLAIRVDIDSAAPWTETTNPTPWYLTGQVGGSPPQWRQGAVGSLAGPPPAA
jgi:hypothetical protein